MKISVKRQAGVALFMALIILLVVSIIGIAAMRTSTISGRIALGTQLDAMVFEAAESAIAETMLHVTAANVGEDIAFDDIAGLFNGDTLVWCFTKAGQRLSGSCEETALMDSRGALRAEARVRSVGFSPVSGNQVSVSGGLTTIIGDFELAIQGIGVMPDYGLVNRHVQNALRRGMIPAQEIE